MTSSCYFSEERGASYSARAKAERLFRLRMGELQRAGVAATASLSPEKVAAVMTAAGCRRRQAVSYPALAKPGGPFAWNGECGCEGARLLANISAAAPVPVQQVGATYQPVLGELTLLPPLTK
jgi:hypothetical protein